MSTDPTADRPRIPDLPCVKCGEVDVSIRWCWGSRSRWEDGRLIVCGSEEHFHRCCKRCGYEWQTNDVVDPAVHRG